MPNWNIENEYYLNGYTIIAGTDEAGRGPLAGRVYAAACILPPVCDLKGLDDSKKLSPKSRDRLFDEIIEEAISFGIAFSTVEEIDELNVLNASLLAMRRAIGMLDPAPDLVLVDGHIIRGFEVKAIPVIDGDKLSVSIAAASVLAKVARDRYCLELDEKYPGYGFARHKGYPTVEHYRAIKELGVTDVHRKSFRLE